MTEHAVTVLKACDTRPSSYNLTSNILSEDSRVVERPLGKELQTAVHGVDSHRAIANQDLIFCWGPKGSRLDFERLTLRSCKPGNGIRVHSKMRSWGFLGFERCKARDYAGCCQEGQVALKAPALV